VKTGIDASWRISQESRLPGREGRQAQSIRGIDPRAQHALLADGAVLGRLLSSFEGLVGRHEEGKDSQDADKQEEYPKRLPVATPLRGTGPRGSQMQPGVKSQSRRGR
jgi:hypothetical protein